MTCKSSGMLNCTHSLFRYAFLTTLKISKLVLTTVGYAQVHLVAEACQSESTGSTSPITLTPAMHNHAVILQKALQCVPNPNTDFIMRNTASRLGQFLTKQVSRQCTVDQIPNLFMSRNMQRHDHRYFMFTNKKTSIVRPKVDQRAGHLSLPHVGITKTQKKELKRKIDEQINPVNGLEP